MKIWTMWIKDQTACSVQSDLDLHCPQKFLTSSIVRKELKYYVKCKSYVIVGCLLEPATP